MFPNELMYTEIMKRIPASIFVTVFAMLLLAQSAMPVFAATASLSLSPTTQTINVGGLADVVVELNTGGAQTSATDLYINYDSAKLILVDIVQGTTYDQYSGKELNPSAGTGKIQGFPSGLDKLYAGTGTFATLKFKGIEAGTSTITIDHPPGDRNKSKVVDYNTNPKADILTTIVNASITVEGPVATPTFTALPTPTLTTDAGNLPTTSSALPTLLISLASVSFVGLGTIFYKKSN